MKNEHIETDWWSKKFVNNKIGLEMSLNRKLALLVLTVLLTGLLYQLQHLQQGFRSEARDMLPKARKPRHVMFSTSRPQYQNKLEQVIAKNSRISMLALERTTVLYYGHDNNAIEKNQFGYPLLRDMYLNAMSVVPDADTYTYSNHDLIFNRSFVETMDAVVYAARQNKIKPSFFVVGHRTNVQWNEHMVIGDDPEDMKSWDFDDILRKGQKFNDEAQDYFTISRNIWDWKTIPPFVVGRIAYDNWLVNRAVTDSNITAIIASDTLGVIHQTNSVGNFQGHKGDNKNDTRYNWVLAKRQWKYGKLNNCQYATYWDNVGTVQIRLRQ